MNSKQRRKLLRKGPSSAAYALLTNEFFVWRTRAYPTMRTVDPYSMARGWLKSKQDHHLDILVSRSNWKAHIPYDTVFHQAVNDEVQDRFERRLLGTVTNTDPISTHGGRDDYVSHEGRESRAD